jgi:hypothetical protein
VIAETTPARTTLLGDPVNFSVADQR